MSDAMTDDRDDELAASTDDDAVVSIISSATPLRAWCRIPTALVDEARVHFEADGIHLTAVDPANVGMVETTAHAEGFTAYRCPDDFDGITVGMNLSRLQNALQWGRMRGDGDPVSLDVLTDPTRIRVAVTRPDQGVKRTSEWFGIDPESIRMEPDVPDLDLDCYADPDITAFYDAVEAFGPNHAAVRYEPDTLVLDAEYDDDGTEAVYLPNSAWTENGDSEPSSMLSLDYLEDMAKGVKRSKADTLTLNWDAEFPVFLDFQHEEWGFESRYLLAPRLSKDD